jgi:cupin 2 domain-containing protein
MQVKNIFNTKGLNLDEEFCETILPQNSFFVERIISEGHITPPDQWYDQVTDEFVLLLKGYAELEFEDKVITLSPGDYLVIPKHKKHRVSKTHPSEKTFWLTIHYK